MNIGFYNFSNYQIRKQNNGNVFSRMSTPSFKGSGLTYLDDLLNESNRKIALCKRILEAEKQKPTINSSTFVDNHCDFNTRNSSIRYYLRLRENGGEKQLSNEVITQLREVESYIETENAKFKNLQELGVEILGYRGRFVDHIESNNTDFDIIKNAKIGDTIIPDTAFSYYAINRSLANVYGGNGARVNNDAVMMITTIFPKNARVSVCNAHGGEIVTPAGAQYILHKREILPNEDMNVFLEYLVQ